MIDYTTELVPLHEADRTVYRAEDRAPEEDPAEVLMEILRPSISEMEPEERRRFCADMEADLLDEYGDYREETGRFFNSLASACRPREPGKELGKRIMEKRNPNYKPQKT